MAADHGASVDGDALPDPAHELISSTRVEGTPVFGQDGRKLGTVHSVMIHKVTGQVAYAVLAFGGLLGMAEHVCSIPWSKLTFDVKRQGYVVELTREEIAATPNMRRADASRLTNKRPTAFI